VKRYDFYWISLPYATYGIEVCDDVIIDCPPISKWMIGKELWEIEEFLTNAEIKQLNNDNNRSIKKSKKISTYCNDTE
jgi:hypothetical protein